MWAEKREEPHKLRLGILAAKREVLGSVRNDDANASRPTLRTAHIVVGRIGFAIWSGGIEIVTARIFAAGISVYVIIVPGILGHFFEELIPALGLGITARLHDERLKALMGPGGITDCGNAQNCVKACPKDIPLTTSIAAINRDTTVAM